jgi:hypothetical protein
MVRPTADVMDVFSLSRPGRDDVFAQRKYVTMTVRVELERRPIQGTPYIQGLRKSTNTSTKMAIFRARD